MLKRTSGGDNETELKELTVAPIRVPSLVTVVTTATPVGNNPSASRKLRSVKVIFPRPFVASRCAAQSSKIRLFFVSQSHRRCLLVQRDCGCRLLAQADMAVALSDVRFWG